jgi:hypothetical protein
MGRIARSIRSALLSYTPETGLDPATVHVALGARRSKTVPLPFFQSANAWRTSAVLTFGLAAGEAQAVVVESTRHNVAA